MHRLATVAALGLGAAVLTVASAVPALAAAPRSKTTTTATATATAGSTTTTTTDGAAVARVAARALAAPAAAAPAPAAKARATHDPTVTISTNCAAFCFVPEQLTVSVGDTVTWVNSSGAAHTVTRCTPAACDGRSGGTGTDPSFSSANIAAASGTTFSHTFTEPGTYVYYCQIHGYALMHGTVTVTAAAAATTTATTSTTASTLTTLTTAPAVPSSAQLASTGGDTEPVTVLAVMLIVCGLTATTFRSRRRHA